MEDGGEAAAGEEFFRSPPFLAAEGVTHTLRIESGEGELLIPLLVRPIDGSDLRDATSPYGYPGAAGSLTAPLDPAGLDLSSSGLVSAFVRHALGPPSLAGASERNVVQIADPELQRKSRPSDRNQANRNRRAGYGVDVVPGPQSSAEDRADFHAAYLETMRRTGAAERYLFDASYFDRILTSERSWLVSVRASGGDVAAASILVQSDGYLHYYLSGTTDRRLSDSPMKNLVEALVDLSIERGMPLNLGGGIAAGDPLEEFKRGFANRSEAWHTSEIVCDAAAYARLSAGREGWGFFPAYRALD
ncbi:MAG TPA: GNAT family N-acetyltransferase [Solirubrobacterales bacterium]